MSLTPGRLQLRVEGTDVNVEAVSGNDDGAMFDLSTRDGRKWRVSIADDGQLQAVVATWESGLLADIGEPDWLETACARLRPPAK